MMYNNNNSQRTAVKDKFDRFEAWLISNGARFDQLELRAYECDAPQPLHISTAEDPDMGEEKKEPSAPIFAVEESEMRGVHAKRHLPPNTVCMSIPRKCLITVEMGQATKIGQAILQSDLDLDAPKHIFLMIYILWDRKVNGSRSFFHPYYEILPPTLHNMPIFWNATELERLQGSYLLHQIADRNQAIADDYTAICQIAPELQHIATLDEFKWARMCVCSRNFGLQIDGHRTSALVPHADMLNHYRPRETKWTFDEEQQAFTITTLQHIAVGSEVLDSYGQKCNHRFLLNYGFAVEDNRELDGFCPNEVPLALTVPTSDPCFHDKLEFWTRGEQQATALLASISHFSPEQAAANAVKRIRVCVSNNENARLLFSLLRALACSPAELRAVSRPSSMNTNNNTATGAESGGSSSSSLFGSSTPPPGAAPAVVLTGSPAPAGATYHRSCRDIRHPISLRNERDSMRLLLETVQAHLARYPTTLQQDLDLLQRADSDAVCPKFSNRRHALIQVRGEKQVLHHFAAWARQALRVLDVIAAELRDEEESLASGGGGGGGNSSSIEVRYGQGRHTTVVTEPPPQPACFDATIRQMERDEDGGVHHTILRFCADVLGSLRREELKNLRRRLQPSRAIDGGDGSRSGRGVGRAGASGGGVSSSAASGARSMGSGYL